jgi:thiaminase/transcriptional activator TenA
MTQCPDCFAYSNYEERSVQTSFTLGLSAIAPCYVVYWTVAKTIAKGISKDNPYYAWILEYSDPKFGQHVAELETMMNEIAMNLSETEWQRMQDAYQRSVHYELLFWTSAYNLATWSPKYEQPKSL